ncbi:MAG: molybdopterin-binding/glycosyltransferase family 2 protein [Rhizobiaceae bacterium]|nr:molybdopterin-binding/glycosyltransferase family 2 protein [Rhizobiaceae bacterium]
MKFGPCPVDDATGAILAHSTKAGDRRLRKAHRLTPDDIAALKAAGIDTVVAARLDESDVDEDTAASRIAAALQIEGAEVRAASTGRVNIHASAAGVLTVDKPLIDALNAIDPAITIATLADFSAVEAGQMVATVKIIPYAVPGADIELAEARAGAGRAFAVHPFRSMRVGLVQTELNGTKKSVLDKTSELTAGRLARSQSSVTAELRRPHEVQAVAEALKALLGDNDMLIVFGASAVSDENDVIPAAIRAAGGSVERTGMPVDPGNLLVVGELGGKPVLGAPGCARSPKLNGFDWVLDRLAAGLPVTSSDIAGMGVGGLLAEIPSRPQPREVRRARQLSLAAVLLAAGKSSRMAGGNKLLALFDGEPLVRRSARALIEAGLAETVVVLGHQAAEIRSTLEGIEIAKVENADFASGIAGSLKAGIRALPASVDGVLVMLADMPEVSSDDIRKLTDAFRESQGTAIVRAAASGQRGNPVILPRVLFDQVETLQGDTGARHIVENSDLDVIDIEIGEAARIDVDTPDALAAAGGKLAG